VGCFKYSVGVPKCDSAVTGPPPRGRLCTQSLVCSNDKIKEKVMVAIKYNSCLTGFAASKVLVRACMSTRLSVVYAVRIEQPIGRCCSH
jgi:hypothetical protein